MKRLFHDWRFGFQLLVRLVIALFCMGIGAGILVGLEVALQFLRLPMPHYLYLLLELLYVILCCTIILASYARYCGYASRMGGLPLL